jgi:Ethanolamine utilization protein EutJ (predicted chaperonin)
MARNGETGRTRWRTDESCREQPDSVEEASLSLHLSLGSSCKVIEVLSKVVVYLEVPVPVCDVCREGIVVSVNGRGDRICSEGIGFAS